MAKLDELRTIISFIQAAQAGSFTQAAEILGITPAAVSKNVSTLEKNLGVRLFNRTTRSLSLTTEGRQFAQQAKIAVDMLTDASEHLKQSLSQPSGLVKISVPNTIGRLFVLPHLNRLHQRYPTLRLELGFNDKVIDFVNDGYDLVLRGGNIQESSLISRQVGNIRLCLVASPDYLAQTNTPETPQQLLQHALIVRRLSNGKLIPWLFHQTQTEHYSLNIEQPAWVVDDAEAMAHLCVNHLGICQLPYYIAQPYLQDGRLLSLLQGYHYDAHFPLVLQYPHRAFIAPRVRAVAEFLVEQLKQEKRLNPA